MSALHPTLTAVTERIIARSEGSRTAYLARLDAAATAAVRRPAEVGCANMAHVIAGTRGDGRTALREGRPNLGIVTAYNDMLSAHQPLGAYPDLLKKAALAEGGVAQVAGGVPAMCDGVTQGREGMEMSLFSRDVIAMATAVSLSHDVFDGTLLLGVCDKIVPGLLIGALSFGHLPAVLVPAGPMPSGLSNHDKRAARGAFARGEIDRDALLKAELAAYHSPGTCTFYGTANTNQMLMEVMGLHVPGSAFVNPGTPLRDALTGAAARLTVRLARDHGSAFGIGRVLDEKALVNGMVGLLATGGSTNHTLHLVAIAAAAGIDLRWDDLSELSTVVPSLARVYPNGAADVNRFHAAGGLGLIIRTLLDAGLMHDDVTTVAGKGLRAYTRDPKLVDGELVWQDGVADSLDRDVVRTTAEPFDHHGGLVQVRGNLGTGIVKTSAVAPEHQAITAPVAVFDSQAQVLAAFQAGELNKDVVVAVRFQGPRANGMPELHKLNPALGVLQDRGHQVALITDGRMSGASGKVLAVVHLCPEADGGGPMARLLDGDVVHVDATSGKVDVHVEDAVWLARQPALPDAHATFGMGRELFATFRGTVSQADHGASAILPPLWQP